MVEEIGLIDFVVYRSSNAFTRSLEETGHKITTPFNLATFSSLTHHEEVEIMLFKSLIEK